LTLIENNQSAPHVNIITLLFDIVDSVGV